MAVLLVMSAVVILVQITMNAETQFVLLRTPSAKTPTQVSIRIENPADKQFRI